AAEEEGVARHRLVELELVALVSAVDLKAPSAVLVALGPARVLDDTVSRDELGDDDLSHGNLLVVRGSVQRRGELLEHGRPAVVGLRPTGAADDVARHLAAP